MKNDKAIIEPITDSSKNRKKFKDIEEALDWLIHIYQSNTQYLRNAFEDYSKGKSFKKRVSACYPYIEIEVDNIPTIDKRMAYGFFSSPGIYRSTITRPDLFRSYYREQFRIIMGHHTDIEICIGVSDMPIPIHFALGENFYLESDLTEEKLSQLPQFFDQPNLEVMDDSVPNGYYVIPKGEAKPLSLFNAPRSDLSLQRLKHYTGTTANHFQKFVIFTNYQFYVDEFVKMGHEIMSQATDPELLEYRKQYTEFVEPGNCVTYNANLFADDTSAEGKKAATPTANASLPFEER